LKIGVLRKQNVVFDLLKMLRVIVCHSENQSIKLNFSK